MDGKGKVAVCVVMWFAVIVSVMCPIGDLGPANVIYLWVPIIMSVAAAIVSCVLATD